MNRSFLLGVWMIVVSFGCADQHRKSIEGALTKKNLPGAPEPADFVPTQDPGFAAIGTAEQDEPGGGAANGKKGGKQAAPVQRKIRYTADVRVICEDLPKAEESLKKAIKVHKGYIANSETTGSPGSPRSGFWKVRLPVSEFEPFCEAMCKLGEVEKNKEDTEDLTDAYYDLEAHIKNKLAEEKSLRDLLETSGKEKMEHLLAIRRELSGVRDDINRKVGKLKLLKNLTDLTTVSVTLREKQKYVGEKPPELVENPTFGMRVGATFRTSWDALVGFVQLALLAAIAVAPWLIPVIVAAVPVTMLARRWRKSLPAIGEVIEPAPPPSS
jgi:hypothetical protein